MARGSLYERTSGSLRYLVLPHGGIAGPVTSWRLRSEHQRLQREGFELVARVDGQARALWEAGLSPMRVRRDLPVTVRIYAQRPGVPAGV